MHYSLLPWYHCFLVMAAATDDAASMRNREYRHKGRRMVEPDETEVEDVSEEEEEEEVTPDPRGTKTQRTETEEEDMLYGEADAISRAVQSLSTVVVDAKWLARARALLRDSLPEALVRAWWIFNEDDDDVNLGVPVADQSLVLSQYYSTVRLLPFDDAANARAENLRALMDTPPLARTPHVTGLLIGNLDPPTHALWSGDYDKVGIPLAVYLTLGGGPDLVRLRVLLFQLLYTLAAVEAMIVTNRKVAMRDVLGGTLSVRNMANSPYQGLSDAPDWVYEPDARRAVVIPAAEHHMLFAMIHVDLTVPVAEGSNWRMRLGKEWLPALAERMDDIKAATELRFLSRALENPDWSAYALITEHIYFQGHWPSTSTMAEPLRVLIGTLRV
jgi:hypothetical protein